MTRRFAILILACLLVPAAVALYARVSPGAVAKLWQVMRRDTLAGVWQLPAGPVSWLGTAQTQEAPAAGYVDYGSSYQERQPPRGYHAVTWKGKRYFLRDAPPGYREVLTDTGAYYVWQVPDGVIEVGEADPTKVTGELPQ